MVRVSREGGDLLRGEVFGIEGKDLLACFLIGKVEAEDGKNNGGDDQGQQRWGKEGEDGGMKR